MKNKENNEHLRYLLKFDDNLLSAVEGMKFSQSWSIIPDLERESGKFKKNDDK